MFLSPSCTLTMLFLPLLRLAISDAICFEIYRTHSSFLHHLISMINCQTEVMTQNETSAYTGHRSYMTCGVRRQTRYIYTSQLTGCWARTRLAANKKAAVIPSFIFNRLDLDKEGFAFQLAAECCIYIGWDQTASRTCLLMC